VRAATDGFVQVRVEITGYTQGLDQADLTFFVGCTGLPEPWQTTITTTPLVGVSELIGPLPIGTTCAIVGWEDAWAGDLGFFGQPTLPGTPATVGEGTTTINITVPRAWNGSWPEGWDAITEIQLDVLTADTAYVNRAGGLTVEGGLWCPSLIGLPLDPYLAIEWSAIQYVGRKTAITARYEPAIAHQCYDPANPGQPVRWRTLGPGTQDKIEWVYASNGKFAVGAVHLEVRVLAHYELLTQWFDPTGPEYDARCSPVERSDGFYDQNGDGLCAYSGDIWGAEQFDLKAIRAR
jgi:hypothetical protein